MEQKKIDSIIYEELMRQLASNEPLIENRFRVGSKKYYEMFNTVRDFGLDIILSESDLSLIKNTDIGRFGKYNNENVPLDSLQYIEINSAKFLNLVSELTALLNELELNDNELVLFGSAYLAINNLRDVNDLDIACTGSFLKELNASLPEYKVLEQTDAETKVLTKYGELSFVDIQALPINPVMFTGEEFDGISVISKQGYLLMKTFDDDKTDLRFFEAQHQGKEVELNKPRRGGSKKFYVYVNDPETGKVKKISFGDTSGLNAKINNPKARKSFAARHRCDMANDKTKASYWSCRLPYYAKSLGLSGGGNFFW